jgi:hypothetical protein
MLDNLKMFLFVLGLGALIGVAIAEGWRRAVHHDSYANYLPAGGESEDVVPSDADHANGRVRGAANRLWSPVAASAKRDWARLRRVPAKPTASAPSN